MTIYLLILLYVYITGIVFRRKIRNRKYYLFAAFLAFSLVLGLRGPHVGEDTNMYLNIAKACKNMTLRSIIQSFPRTTWSIDQWGYHNTVSTGFMIWTKAIVTVFRNPQVLLIITSIFICFGFAKFIYQNTSQVFTGTYIFLADSIFMMAFNGMRQCFAMAIALQSYYCFKNSKWVKGIIYIAIAALIHVTSLVYFLLIPIMMIKDKKKEGKYIIAIVILSPILLSLLQRIILRFSSYYGSYFSTTFWSGSLRGTLILWLFIIISWIISFLLNKKDKSNEEYTLVYLIMIYLSLEIAGIRATMVSRLALYFRAFLILYFPMILNRMDRKNNKLILIVLLGILMTVEFLSYAKSPSRIYNFFWNA